jgi:hypothetical protein
MQGFLLRLSGIRASRGRRLALVKQREFAVELGNSGEKRGSERELWLNIKQLRSNQDASKTPGRGIAAIGDVPILPRKIRLDLDDTMARFIAARRPA